MHFGVVRQIGVNDETEVRQIDAARRDVGRDADPRASVAQRLQRRGALVLRQFARQRDHGEAALQQRRLQMPHRVARVAEHQRARRFEEAQHVDDGVLDIGRGDPDGAVLDIGMAAFVAGDFDAKRLAADSAWPARRCRAASVAENNSVRRVAGVVLRMNSMSSRKPRSSISSASSSTTAFSCETSRRPRRK